MNKCYAMIETNLETKVVIFALTSTKT